MTLHIKSVLFIIEVMVLQLKAIQVIFYATMFYIINVNIKNVYEICTFYYVQRLWFYYCVQRLRFYN